MAALAEIGSIDRMTMNADPSHKKLIMPRTWAADLAQRMGSDRPNADFLPVTNLYKSNLRLSKMKQYNLPASNSSTKTAAGPASAFARARRKSARSRTLVGLAGVDFIDQNGDGPRLTPPQTPVGEAL